MVERVGFAEVRPPIVLKNFASSDISLLSNSSEMVSPLVS
jgi:hypothetical protein